VPATADKLVPTSLDILRSALQRGVTGRLSRGGGRAPSPEVYVMQGQILAAHGPDDGPWIVRRLVNSGALTERQGKAFIRRLTRGIPFDELILGHVPDSLLEELLAGRFRQNLLDFLSSAPPIDFQQMDTLFVPNLQSGLDTRNVLASVVELRERIGPLMRHRGPLTLRLGPSMPSNRQEARLVDLCDPPIPLRDLLTYSPYEAGETLDHVMSMLSNGALVSREGIRLQRTRGHGPTADYAVEELFNLESPVEPKPSGTPAGPIPPEHLGLLREESETPVLGDFGRVPPAFRGDHDISEEAELPRLNTSHLVLVSDTDDDRTEPSAPPRRLDSMVPVLVESVPSLVDSQADLTRPSTGLFEERTSKQPDGSDLLAQGGMFFDADSEDTPAAPAAFKAPTHDEPEAPQAESARSAPLQVATADAGSSAQVSAVAEPEPAEDDDSVPESWRDLSALGFGQAGSVDLSGPPPDSAPSEASRPQPADEGLSTDSMVYGAYPTHDEPPDSVLAAEVVEDSDVAPLEVAPVEAYFDPDSASLGPAISSTPGPMLAEPIDDDAELEFDDDSQVPVEAMVAPDDDALFGGNSLQALFEGAPAPEVAEAEPPADHTPIVADMSPVDDTPFVNDSAFIDADTDVPPDAPVPSSDPTDELPAEPSEPGDSTGNALVDAARRYLEEATSRRKNQRRTTFEEPEPEPDAPTSGERKFTGFDFDVDDSEMAMFADHDHYRGGGQGQFTLGKDLLDRVELVPAGKPEKVRLPEPHPGLPPDDDSLIEMGEATAEEEAEAGVVALAFSAPTLDADQVFHKIEVASEVAQSLSRSLDAAIGPGVGQATIQLLVDAAAGPFARLFIEVRVDLDGSLDVDRVFDNLQTRPSAEQRSLLDRGLMDFIERALSTAAEELPDDALDAMLSEIAGYQQRLRQ
jgi:hypothetical protein